MSAPSGYRIEQAMSAFQSARARMIADDPDAEAELGEAEGDVMEILGRILRASVEASDLAKAAKERADAIRDRAARFKERADNLRGVAFSILDALGERKIVLPDLTASMTAGRTRPVVTDEALVPEEYFRVVRQISNSAIADDIKVGVVIPGVELETGLPFLTVRTK